MIGGQGITACLQQNISMETFWSRFAKKVLLQKELEIWSFVDSSYV